MEPIDRVKDMVRRALVTNPSVRNQELFDRAREIAPSVVEGLTLTQFHARFRLPILRNEMAKRPEPAERKRRRRPRQPEVAVTSGRSLRLELRDLFVRFAVDLENAQSRSDLVRVVAGIDAYIDEVVRITAAPAAPAPTPLSANVVPAVIPAAEREPVPETPALPPAPQDAALREAFRAWRDSEARPGQRPLAAMRRQSS
jgi:hypothetical protein